MYYIETIPNLKLYHGTTSKHESIDLSFAKPLKDFGLGYYLTSHFSQAKKWALRLKIKTAYIYEYTPLFPLDGLEIFELLEYNDAWLRYVTVNRFSGHPTPDYDIVYNKMADNTAKNIYEIVRNYAAGKMSSRDAVNLLKWEKTVADQFCFKTDRALAHLKRTKVITYTLEDDDTWKETITLCD